jgi:hypothetical protein
MSDFPAKSAYRPKYYDLLTPSDQGKYNELRATLSSQMCRNRRGKRLEGFSDMLASIRNFCIRHHEDDWKRCLVCGVCWLPTGIAINNCQLSILIDKCKSSINGSLQKMGYSTFQNRNESSGSLCELIPVLKNNFGELREWTVRLFVAATPQPNLPLYTVNTLHPFQSPIPSHYQALSTRPRSFMPPPLPVGVPTRKTPPASISATTFFDDEFTLPPTFLTEDAPPAPVPGPPRASSDFDLLGPEDPVSFPDDPFGLYGDKW